MTDRWARHCAELLMAGLSGPLLSCAAATPVVVPGPRAALSEAQRAGLDDFPGSDNVSVAEIDGGIDDSHPSLSGAVVARWVAPGLDPGSTAHATQIAGIIAGRPTATYGGGLAPKARLLDVKVLSAAGSGDPHDMAAGLTWARQNGAGIVVTSLAVESDDPAVRASVNDLTSVGIAVVAATGNGIDDLSGGDRSGAYPAAYPGVIGATASGRDGKLLALAKAQSADFIAPGDRITAPSLRGTYAEVSGTSIAAAMVTGTLAGCSVPHPADDTALAGWSHGHVTVGGRTIATPICQRPGR